MSNIGDDSACGTVPNAPNKPINRIMDNDFRKYATRHLGMSGMVLDDVVSMQDRKSVV